MRRERPGHTLQTGGLIDEAFLRLAGQNRVHWQSREHFYAIAATCMRLVLIDHARAHQRAKRAGLVRQLSTRDADLSDEQSEELLALNEALDRLAKKDMRKSKVVELRYFGGYSFEEVAGILKVSEATVARDWRLARAWLRRELKFSAGVSEPHS
jgi:RNA polymerase sigma factor (TIGR02999 family)